MLRRLLVHILCAAPYLASAQGLVCIDSILIAGNFKTKVSVISRELTHQKGDCIPIAEIQDFLEQNRSNLLNTGLFSEVTINISSWDTEKKRIHLSVSLREAWYIFPIPVFELADRNFNVWWVEQNRSLERANYGIRLDHLNFSGNADHLSITAQTGYSQKAKIEYKLPYLDRNKFLRARVSYFYSRNRETAVETFANKHRFVKFEDGFAMKRSEFLMEMSFRRGIHLSHYLRYVAQNTQVNPEIPSIHNNQFFKESRENQKISILEYELGYDTRNLKAYPTSGIYLQMILRKEGLSETTGLNTTRISLKGDAYFKVTNLVGIENTVKARFTPQNRTGIPYFNSKSLGYEEDYIRGYEYYIVDGTDYFYNKAEIRWNLMETTFHANKWMPIRQFSEIPTSVYLTTFLDIGYVYGNENAGNDLVRETLLGYGIGLDILLYHFYTFQIEYSMNKMGEKGLFLHYKFGF